MFRCLTMVLCMGLSISAQRRSSDEAAFIADQLTQANSYFKAARLSEAKEVAEQVLRTEPGNATALKIKGNAEYLLGEVSTAINTFIDLLDKHPNDEDAPYMLGRIYYQEGTVDQAIGQFERVLRLNAYSYKAYDNLGLC